MVSTNRGRRRLPRGLMCEDESSRSPEPLLTIVEREGEKVVVLVQHVSGAIVMISTGLPLWAIIQE